MKRQYGFRRGQFAAILVMVTSLETLELRTAKDGEVGSIIALKLTEFAHAQCEIETELMNLCEVEFVGGLMSWSWSTSDRKLIRELLLLLLLMVVMRLVT